MNETIPLFPEQASTVAPEVDALFLMILAISAVVSLLIAGTIVVFAVRYRRRADGPMPPRILGSNLLEFLWSAGPLVIFLVMFVWGAKIYFGMAQPPDDSLVVYVVGKQWMWKLQHPGGQREINELHVPVGRPVKLLLTSEDVIHSFSIPSYRMKVDVLPGRYVTAWFQASRTGRYRLYCNQFCGTNHSGMVGTVIAMEPTAYQEWLESRAEGSLALEGRKLFLKLQCVSCHGAGPESRPRAPILEDLIGRRVTLRDGGPITADETYIRESIVNPRAKIVAGWEPIMPTFRGQVGEDELIALVAYIKSLGPGQTPLRTEHAAPPVSALEQP